MRDKIDDPDLTLDVLFRTWPMVTEVFIAHRMLCPCCPIAPFHTVIDACVEYQLDENEFRASLRRAAFED